MQQISNPSQSFEITRKTECRPVSELKPHPAYEALFSPSLLLCLQKQG